MTAEILSVGTELLMGQIANTDAQYLSRRLAELGISLYRHTVVGDNPVRLREALQEALKRADLVITTGGLGPTEDDLTKETAAELFGMPLRLHGPSLEALEGRMRAMDRPVTENSRKQAMLPEGAIVMPNACGTAPGCILERNGRTVAVLPGPPHEMQDMFERCLAPLLRERAGARIVSRFLSVFGIGEPALENMLIDLLRGENPTAALYCGAGEIRIRLSARAGSEEAAQAMLEPVEAEIRRRVGDALYGSGPDCTLQQAVFALLKARGETVCFAESCTGGRMAASLVDISGASDVLKESYVTYCDEAKARILGVSPETLDRHTAVSAEVAREMANGVRRISGADWGVSVTGLAGPGGGTDRIPVGTVFIGIACEGETLVYEFHIPGSRDRVRLLAVSHGFNLLRLRMLRS